MNNLTPELIAKAKAATTAEELMELAKENGVELTADEAKICFDQLSANGAVADEELDMVAGGCGEPSEEDVEYQEGDIVKFFDGTTCACGYSTCIIGRAPHLRYGAFLRCTNCQEIICDHIPYDRVSKV